MSDYDAVYNAVRSKMTGCDIGQVIESAIMSMNLSHYVEQAMYSFQLAGYEQQRPSVLFKPALYPDGDKWCALFGEDLQIGVAGFGDTPHLAMANFDDNWLKQKLPSKKQEAAHE